MTLKIVSSYNGVSDPDAAAYISAVEAADGELLEFAVGKAINDFVLGCKQDSIWDAIKASCILSGARTLAGALVPLVGTAPTNYNFVADDYDRKTGLVGDGSTKYLDSNRACSVELTADIHISAYISTPSNQTVSSHAISNDYTGVSAPWTGIQRVSDGRLFIANRNASGSSINIFSSPAGNATGLMGSSRASSSSYTIRQSQSNYPVTQTALGASASNFSIFARTDGASAEGYSNARLAFYSIGESLDLAKLDGRVTDLINKFSEVIP